MMGYVISINSHRWSFSFTIRTLIRALITWLKGKHQEKKKGLSELERQNLKFLFQNYLQHYFGLSCAMTQQPLNTKLLICRFHKITYLCEGSTRGFFFLAEYYWQKKVLPCSFFPQWAHVRNELLTK